MSKRAAIIEMGRRGDILCVLPQAYHLHKEGYQVDWYVHPGFADILEPAGYVTPVLINHDHRDVRTARSAAEAKGVYEKILVTQVDGNDRPSPIWTPNFVTQMWARGIGLDHFHTSPLIFDRRDKTAERFAAELYLQPTPKPILLLCLSGHSSPFYVDNAKPDNSAELFEAWVQLELTQYFEIVDISKMVFPKPHHLLGLLERAAVLVSIDTMAVHMAYATNTPTVVLSRRERYFQSEPRKHWAARVTYDQANQPAGWQKILDALLNVIGMRAGTIKPIDITRETKPVNPEKLVHVVDYYLPPGKHPDKDRIIRARHTWEITRMQDANYKFVIHDTAKHATRTSKTMCGDTRNMPVVKDIIDFGVAQAEEMYGKDADDVIVVVTNSDIGLCPEAPQVIRESMTGKVCCFSRRKDVVRASRRFTMAELARVPDHVGADLFAVRPAWWKAHKHEVPDLLHGVEGWDAVMRIQMRKYNPDAQMPTMIYHEKHASFWANSKNIKANPGQKWNRSMIRDWCKANGCSNALHPESSPFLFRLDGTWVPDAQQSPTQVSPTQ